MSRQREYQKKRVADGKCAGCGKPRNKYAHHCDECQAKAQENRGHKPWVPGGRGRPPLSFKRPPSAPASDTALPPSPSVA